MDSFKNSRSSASQEQRYHIEKNSRGSNEILIPYFEQETSSTIYHLQEELRLLKKHNKHLQQHIERMKQQYQQLKATIQFLDTKEKEQIKKNNELHLKVNDLVTKYHDIKNEKETLKIENQELKNDLMMANGREEDWKKKNHKLKQIEVIHTSKISELESQIDLINAQLLDKSRNRPEIQSRTIFQLEISELKEQINVYVEKLTKSNLQNEEKNKQLERLKEKKFNENSSDIQQKFKRIQRENSRLKEDLQDNQMKNKKNIEKLKNSIKIKEEQQQSLINQMNKLRRQNRELNDKISDHIFEINKRKESKNSFQTPSKQKIWEERYHHLSEQFENFKAKSKQTQHQTKYLQKYSESKILLEKIKELQFKISQYQNRQYKKQEKQPSVKDFHDEKDPNKQLENYYITVQNLRLAEAQIRNLKKELENKVEQLDQLNDQIKKHKIEIKKIKQQILKYEDKSGGNEGKFSKNSKSNEVLDDKQLDTLDSEYRGELNALKRLLLYKCHPQIPQNDNQMKIRMFYEAKLDGILKQYKQIQKQLLDLRQELLMKEQKILVQDNCMEIDLSQEERRMYVEAIRRWQLAYEQLEAIYETKIVSKDEQINLLNLRLINKYEY